MVRIHTVAGLFCLSALPVVAQTPQEVPENWLLSPGITGSLILLLIVFCIGILILYARISAWSQLLLRKKEEEQRQKLREELTGLSEPEIDRLLEERKLAKTYQLSGMELGGKEEARDAKGLIANLSLNPERPMIDEKRQSRIQLETPASLTKIVIWFIGASVFWLFFGTLIGQYAGMKFVWPDIDHSEFLSFGRIRPIHTNTVFWGWASMAMIGLAYFVVSRTSNRSIYSTRLAWVSWILINTTLVLGNLSLFLGFNNGGGEYREYTWPVMLPFATALLLTFFNFYKTVAGRKIQEIYISNWYILAALLWTLVLVCIGYLPFYQNGLGETVIQGYYMHQGVGMWFMTFTLGLIYYYLPSSLNKPIYSYSLGVLAFWTQMLFYTLIGTHHFIFSPLPWWLQTIAIVFSAGMFIPVVAGSTNFLMTFRGSWRAVGTSYSLPFFLVGVIFYFVGSTQGSFQAFPFTNYVWHFTDFNVAHSHMTMYGIVSFILWACIYTILPKLTGKEPRQLFVGVHFWLAFVGLAAYMISLMTGGTLKGISWMEGKPFIDSVTLMFPYWVWRAVGGSLMFISHLVFAWNFYTMISFKSKSDV